MQGQELAAVVSLVFRKGFQGRRAVEGVEVKVTGLVVSDWEADNPRIAEAFSISQYTVKHHLTKIYDKVGVYHRLELAMFALHHRLALPALESSRTTGVANILGEAQALSIQAEVYL